MKYTCIYIKQYWTWIGRSVNNVQCGYVHHPYVWLFLKNIVTVHVFLCTGGAKNDFICLYVFGFITILCERINFIRFLT